ncbi:M20 family metallopeptidase [Salinarimonas rosea]|uniref:M20 family metallopeptidase n=1 Tax=Salinarimonas rosea TaxID=552063 RepID=UPI00040F4499|nr:M20 family metallopeptidase [Salinarimonas rosea]
MPVPSTSAAAAFSADARIARMVEDVCAWARHESPTGDAAAVDGMMDRLVAGLEGEPVSIERLPGRDGLGGSVIVRAGPTTKVEHALVLSHLDTVHPIGTLEDGLPVRVEGDRIYGPGVYDMKGGAYLALQGFLEVARKGTAKRPMVFLFTPDEEIGSPTTRALIEHLGRDAAAVLVTEPARDGGKIVTCRKGVGRFEVHVEGRPAHSGSRHAEGRNAIHEAARQIAAIEAMTDYDRGITTTVGLIKGGTAMNTIPQHCRFAVDLRVETAADGEALARAILGLSPQRPDFTVTVTGGMNRPTFERTPQVAALYETAVGLAAEIGFALEETVRTGGGSDGNFTAGLGVPTLDGLGIDGDGAHTLEEYGLASSLGPRAMLMARLLETV